MEMFIKTYAKKKTLLGLAFGIYEGTSALNKCASEVNECKSGVSGAFKRYLYEKERDERENSCPSSNGILSRWICIEP